MVMKDKAGTAGIGLALAFIILSGVAAASPFTVPATGNPQLNLTTNRLVILDDPSGWDGGSASPAIIDRGNQWSAESTTIRWYVLLINSSGRAAQGITVTSQLLFPNGTVALTKTNITDSSGIAEFDQDMDRWLRSNGSGSEGIYTINAVSTSDGSPVAASYNFRRRYDAYPAMLRLRPDKEQQSLRKNILPDCRKRLLIPAAFEFKHNVSKPNNATGTSNTFTEFQQCTACHNAQKRHNDSVSCTVCHSQDAHLIKTFSQDAVYVNGTGGAIAGNCTGCHQNLSFLDTLLLQPGAGFHSGNAPQVSKPTNHSNAKT